MRMVSKCLGMRQPTLFYCVTGDLASGIDLHEAGNFVYTAFIGVNTASVKDAPGRKFYRSRDLSFEFNVSALALAEARNRT